MDFDKIEEDETYKIRTTGGGYTFGTVLEKAEDATGEQVVTWRSDHPEADCDHWARPEQIVCKVAAGTYLGDNGKPVR